MHLGHAPSIYTKYTFTSIQSAQDILNLNKNTYSELIMSFQNLIYTFIYVRSAKTRHLFSSLTKIMTDNSSFKGRIIE